MEILRYFYPNYLLFTTLSIKLVNEYSSLPTCLQSLKSITRKSLMMMYDDWPLVIWVITTRPLSRLSLMKCFSIPIETYAISLQAQVFRKSLYLSLSTLLGTRQNYVRNKKKKCLSNWTFHRYIICQTREHTFCEACLNFTNIRPSS